LRSLPAKQFLRTYLKNTQHKKRSGGVAQVVEHLPNRFKALTLQERKKSYLGKVSNGDDFFKKKSSNAT
jgi:hypothetical protein